jgi:hypothetical protein
MTSFMWDQSSIEVAKELWRIKWNQLIHW